MAQVNPHNPGNGGDDGKQPQPDAAPQAPPAAPHLEPVEEIERPAHQPDPDGNGNRETPRLNQPVNWDRRFSGALVLFAFVQIAVTGWHGCIMIGQNNVMQAQNELLSDQLKAMRDQNAEMVEQTKASKGQWDATDKQFKAMIEANGVAAEASKAAEKAAIAASNSNEIAASTAERQQRAYVFAASATFAAADKSDVHTLTLKIRNYGQTPAYSVAAYADFWYLEPPFREPKEQYLRVSMRPRSISTVGPGGETTVKVRITIAKNKLEELRNGRLQLMAHGAISYYDMFALHHFVPIRYRWGGDLSVDEMIPSVTGLPEQIYEGVPDEKIDDYRRLTPEQLRQVRENFRKYGRGRDETIGDNEPEPELPPGPRDE